MVATKDRQHCVNQFWTQRYVPIANKQIIEAQRRRLCLMADFEMIGLVGGLACLWRC